MFRLMYHFHAGEKIAHASWLETRKHVNTQYVVYGVIMLTPNQSSDTLAHVLPL